MFIYVRYMYTVTYTNKPWYTLRAALSTVVENA